MERYVLVPDSFKGTLSSREICEILREEILRVRPAAEVIAVPVADGGEGSVDAFLAAMGGERVEVPVHGPHMEEMTGFYGLLPDGTAVIEMAAAAGLPLVGDRLEPDTATTYGVGELMAAAAENGAQRIILGLGGSATNDGGCGAAAALGVRFLRKDGTAFIPTGGTLNEIESIDLSGRCALPDVTVMCDIDNPLCGPSGASAVFGPQKGADPAMVERLDWNLAHLADVIARDLGKQVKDVPGAGAAGGMGGGSLVFWDGRLQMGIQTVLDTVGFDQLVQGAKLVFTGEGRLDSQSLRGKVIDGVAKRAKKHGVPVVAVVGAVSEGADEIYDLGVCGVFTTNHAPVPFEIAKLHSHENLRRTARNLMGFLTAMEQR
ncbi:MAG: glycerate kinase [Oscillibacter sp.]|nr:glycerate kinase [Oscillibacter sp.]